MAGELVVAGGAWDTGLLATRGSSVHTCGTAQRNLRNVHSARVRFPDTQVCAPATWAAHAAACLAGSGGGSTGQRRAMGMAGHRRWGAASSPNRTSLASFRTKATPPCWLLTMNWQLLPWPYVAEL